MLSFVSGWAALATRWRSANSTLNVTTTRCLILWSKPQRRSRPSRLPGGPHDLEISGGVLPPQDPGAPAASPYSADRRTARLDDGADLLRELRWHLGRAAVV